MTVTINGTTGMPASAAQFLIGQVCHFAMATPPAGFLPCEGQLISRTAYAGLFAAIGTLYGVGDGSTTFKLPDLRGEFIRGVDKGRGVDASRALGSPQGDAIRNLTGDVSFAVAGSLIRIALSPNGAFAVSGSGIEIPAISTAVAQPISDPNRAAGVGFDASRIVPTAPENRPRNVAMTACIFTGVA